jgi:5-methylcytosine-specific restriction endonuclease McrA
VTTYPYAYRKLRPAYLAQHPDCHYCGKKATTIDHVLPVSIHGIDPLDVTN